MYIYVYICIYMYIYVYIQHTHTHTLHRARAGNRETGGGEDSSRREQLHAARDGDAHAQRAPHTRAGHGSRASASTCTFFFFCEFGIIAYARKIFIRFFAIFLSVFFEYLES